MRPAEATLFVAGVYLGDLLNKAATRQKTNSLSSISIRKGIILQYLIPGTTTKEDYPHEPITTKPL